MSIVSPKKPAYTTGPLDAGYSRSPTCVPVEPEPIPMLLWCPECHKRHVDGKNFASQPHHTHACQHCGVVWRPALVPTVGVQFLPGFKDEP